MKPKGRSPDWQEGAAHGEVACDPRQADDSAEVARDAALIPEAVQRRWWLLRRAMDAAPLDVAVKIAAAAEAFVVAGSAAVSAEPTEPPASGDDGSARRPVEHEPATECSDATADDGEAASALLTAARKAELGSRIASGAPNGELSAEFRLTPRQVQGFRMQLARKLKRSDALARRQHAAGPESPPLSPFVEEVVRFLRQQGDTVVGSAQSGFRVNNRFTLDFEQLVHLANRIRKRQGLPEFGTCERQS